MQRATVNFRPYPAAKRPARRQTPSQLPAPLQMSYHLDEPIDSNKLARIRTACKATQGQRQTDQKKPEKGKKKTHNPDISLPPHLGLSFHQQPYPTVGAHALPGASESDSLTRRRRRRRSCLARVVGVSRRHRGGRGLHDACCGAAPLVRLGAVRFTDQGRH